MNRQIEKNKTFCQSLKHARDGIKIVWLEERNFRFDLLGAVLALVLATFLKVSRLEWCWVLFCIFLMFMLEMFNTVVEQLVDLMVEHRYHLAAKKAKDVAAGVVLVGSLFVLIVAAIIFIPKMLERFII